MYCIELRRWSKRNSDEKEKNLCQKMTLDFTLESVRSDHIEGRQAGEEQESNKSMFSLEQTFVIHPIEQCKLSQMNKGKFPFLR